MEIEYYSYDLDRHGRFYSHSVLVFILVLGVILSGNFIVLADPSSSMSIVEDSKIPLSKRMFDSSNQWRTPKKSKNKWRESEEYGLTLQKGRIKKKSSSIYDIPQVRDNWDPYTSPGAGNNMLTKPAKVFEFRF